MGMLGIWKQIAMGKTLMRARMNEALAKERLIDGEVLDLGGRKNPSYRHFLKCAPGTRFVNIDKQHGEGAQRDIDFETDRLPYEDGSIRQVLMLNLLEHIYEYQHLVSEVYRVLAPDSSVIGFVPFLVNYHADPHDYFRYTDEALARIFKDAGFSGIRIDRIGGGPFSANFNGVASFMPRYVNAALWPFYWALDGFFIALKPALCKRFPLGYLFVLTK